MSKPGPRAESAKLAPPVSEATRRIGAVNWGKTHVAALPHTSRTKTEITPEAAISIAGNAAHATDAGQYAFQRGGNRNNMTLVPRRSNPDELRLIGTHTGGGAVDAEPTSFPVNDRGAIAAAYAYAGKKKIVHEPDTPPLSPRK